MGVEVKAHKKYANKKMNLKFLETTGETSPLGCIGHLKVKGYSI